MTFEADPVSEILGTGYSRFIHPCGTAGLCKVTGDAIELLAVVDKNPGNGHFRGFISDLKENFKTIKIWHVENPWLPDVLVRYGFRPWEEKQCVAGEWEALNGFRWDV